MANTNPVKVAMIGVGAISGIYLKNITNVFKEVELVGVCDLIPERAEKGVQTVKEYIEAEMKHNDLLAANVSQVLIPLEKHASVRNGKRVVKEKVSLPGYVFVEARLKGDVAHTLRFMPNVLGFLGGLDEPTPVLQRDINRMLGTVEETEFEENLDCPYLVNDTVKVMEGPFSGFSGVIEEVNLEKRKLKVTVKIFGRKTPLELGFMQVEKE